MMVTVLRTAGERTAGETERAGGMSASVSTAEIVIIGVPTSAGAHHAGQERAPEALRAAGLAARLRDAGLRVTDAGDLVGAVFAPDPQRPEGRNLRDVIAVAARLAAAVASVAGSGRLPLVLGGDCSITIGAVAGLLRAHPDAALVYLDGDADLEVPGDGGSGIFDSMGIAHLLGRGAAELAGLDGREPPLLDGSRLAILGSDPRETTDEGRRFLADSGVSFEEAPAFIADPAGAAKRALAAVGGSDHVLVHFDVDVVDSGDLPLGNFPHYGSGVSLEAAKAGLAELRQSPAFAGLVLTEVNPTHDPAGAEVDRLTGALVSVLAA
jgi:arginase